MVVNKEYYNKNISEYNKFAQEAISVSDKIIVYDLIKKTKETDDLLEQYQNNKKQNMK